jgi:hypothetical protein
MPLKLTIGSSGLHPTPHIPYHATARLDAVCQQTVKGIDIGVEQGKLMNH